MSHLIYLTDHANLASPKLLRADRDGKIIEFDSWQTLMKNAAVGKKAVLEVKLNATHSGTIVNRRVYPGKHMLSGLSSWVKPYGRPVLNDHPSFGMFASGPEPVVYGRVDKAEYVRLIQDEAQWNVDWKNPVIEGLGSGFTRLTTFISHEEGMDAIIGGRALTVSTGATTTTHTCSICGSRKGCDHVPGHYYTAEELADSIPNVPAKGKFLCYSITGPLTYDHVAFVNTPAQPYAAVVSVEMKDAKEQQKSGEVLKNYSIQEITLMDEHGKLHFTLNHTPEPTVADAQEKRVTALISKLEDADPEPTTGFAKRPGVGEGTVVSIVTVDRKTTQPANKETTMDTVTPNQLADSVVLKSIVDGNLEFDWEGYKTKTGRDRSFATSVISSELPDKYRKFDASAYCGPKNTIPVVDQDTAEAARRILPFVMVKGKAKIDAAISDRLYKEADADCGCDQKPTDTADSLRKQYDEAVRANGRLTEENKILRSKVRASLVDRILGLRVALGKADIVGLSKEDRSKYADRFMSRSIESLEDSIADLELENEKRVATRDSKPVIQDPTAPATVVEKGTKDKKDEGEKVAQPAVDNSDPMVKLMRS